MVVVLGLIAFLVTTTFASARVDVTVATADIAIDGDRFSATREPLRTADIPYTLSQKYTKVNRADIMDFTRENERSFATGTLMVYNTNLSGSRLDLVNRTRFQTADGRIYRLSGKHTIPGGTTVAGEFRPGSAEVKVEADEIGERYNIPERGERFSIPGLQKYDEFANSYALSETKIVGGFSGEKFIPNQTEESEARAKLRREIEQELRDELQQSLDTNTLSKRIVFESGIFIEYESLENVQGTDSVAIQEQGSLRAILFSEKELATLLSRYAPEDSPGSVAPARLTANGLVMEIESGQSFSVFEPSDSNEFYFRLQGDATIAWDVDELLFRGDIAGKNRAEAEVVIFQNYPQITEVNAIRMFPIWRTNLPNKRAKIALMISGSSGDI